MLGKAPAAEMLTAVERLMGGLKLTVNEQKTDNFEKKVAMPAVPRGAN